MRSELLSLLTPHAAQKGSLSESYEGVWLRADGQNVEALSIGRYGVTWTSAECPWEYEARVGIETLLRALKASKDEIDSIFVDGKNRLEIQMGAHVVRLPTYPPPEWGPGPVLKEPQSGHLAVQDFLGVAVASDERDQKTTCNGVQVEDGWMFATDSHRLHAVKTNLVGSLRIPRAIEGMLKTVSPPLVLEYDTQRFRLLSSDEFEHIAALEAKPPIKWQALLHEPQVFLEFSGDQASEFVFALQRANKITDEPGILSVKDGMLVLGCRGDATETFLREEEDFALNLAFNMQYLLDAIAFVGWDESLTLQCVDSKTAIVLREGDRLVMVMPVRV